MPNATKPAQRQTAYFALGCFWEPDVQYAALPGVLSTTVGYAGGTKDRPTYQNLGDHTETVAVEFDPEQISYDQLLEKFWAWHDAGVAQKTQYQSLILYADEAQRAAAEKSKAAREGSGSRVTTEVRPAGKFWKAEEYHQDYLRKCGLA